MGLGHSKKKVWYTLAHGIHLFTYCSETQFFYLPFVYHNSQNFKCRMTFINHTDTKTRFFQVYQLFTSSIYHIPNRYRRLGWHYFYFSTSPIYNDFCIPHTYPIPFFLSNTEHIPDISDVY